MTTFGGASDERQFCENYISATVRFETLHRQEIINRQNVFFFWIDSYIVSVFLYFVLFYFYLFIFFPDIYVYFSILTYRRYISN